jgi:prepilin peptidase CpaA
MTGLPVSGKPGESVGGAAESAGTLPYGVAIAAGTMAYLAMMRWD